MKALRSILAASVICLPALSALAQPAPALRDPVSLLVQQEYPSLFELYKHLHTHPELSFQEEKTAPRFAEELRKAGFEVTTGVGKFGVVGVLRNGTGPTVLVRTDMDGLPVQEQTGLPYASTATARDSAGKEVPVMHACGHDLHMACAVGTARVLNQLKDKWSGTLIFIGQPAEERGAGARAMLADGLFKRFPRPDYCLALHDNAQFPAGTVTYTSGFALANVDSVDVTIRGVGGHGAYPHKTRDPVVLAAQIILALQTIVSREVEPGEPSVVTVGSIHGGTKHNIIPDDVFLQLTVRSYTDEVRQQILDSIRRIVRGQAIAAGVPEDKLPVVTLRDEFTPATYNNPELTARLTKVFTAWLGEANVAVKKPVMGGEDFGEFGRTVEKIPICIFDVGGVSPEALKQSQASGKPLPSLHSPLWAPVPEPTLKTGMTAMCAAVLELMGKK
jgi:amidohydrolase